MSNLSGSFKQKKVYFSQVSNSALRDNDLSLKAKGLYSLIQSYITIEGFILYKTTLKRDCTEGETAFQGAWDELKKAGYLVQYKHSLSNGKFSYEYDLLDSSDINHTPINHPMVKPVYGKHRVYNNTDINNTDLSNTKYHSRRKDGKLTARQLKATANVINNEICTKRVKGLAIN